MSLTKHRPLYRVLATVVSSRTARLTLALSAMLQVCSMSNARAADGSFEVLYSFTEGSDGGQPQASLLLDKAGNLYGTTALGGSGFGTVFKVSPGGTETVLYAFQNNGKDGVLPYAGVIADKAGNLYGTTPFGGTLELGIIYKLAPGGTETVLHDFMGNYDDGQPWDSLLLGKGGKLYGTTSGAVGSYGTVFEISRPGDDKVLYGFTGGSDGSIPFAGLITDAAGNFYGTTRMGGASGAGTVFKLTPQGSETVLYSFSGGSDGGTPLGGLIADSAGNLYGTTSGGGGAGYGTVFKLAPPGAELTLHSFTGGNDGANPHDTLIRDQAGNLFGTTDVGGADGFGTVFEIRSDGTFKLLHTFTNGVKNSNNSNSGLVADKAGNLYGTTEFGGAKGYGEVYRLRK